MGRARRIDASGVWHHLMNRGAGRRIVFRCDEERKLFVSLVSELERRFGVEVHGYCLMGNHYHLLVRSMDARVSEAMAWLSSRFTREVNGRRGVDGAVFRGRFTSVVVARDAHLIWLYRYINANPRDLEWSGPLVQYPWSGLAASTGRVDNDWLCHSFARAHFGEDADALERFVEAVPTVSRSTLGGVVDSDIAAAAHVARSPGPGVNRDAEVRAAHTVVAKRLAIDQSLISTMSDLNPRAAASYSARASRLAAAPGPVGALVERIESVLVYEFSSSGV